MPDHPWTDAVIVALDLEGTGAQDHEHEAILEIATVPLAGGLPDVSRAYETLINPGRPVPRRPWISRDAALDVGDSRTFLTDIADHLD